MTWRRALGHAAAFWRSRLQNQPFLGLQRYHEISQGKLRESCTRQSVVGLLGAGAVTLGLGWWTSIQAAAEDGKTGALWSSEATVKLEELARHNRRDDLWVAIDGDVWDVTEFSNNHPGGSGILLEHGGRDVSTVFHKLHPDGTVQSHLLPSQLVGQLNEQVILARRATLPGVDTVVTLSDFEKYAQRLLPAAAWQYYSFGAESEAGLRNNESAYDRIFFRPRVMRDVSRVDLSTTVLGVKSSLPVYATPVASMGLGQELGEIATTHAAARQGILQILSFSASKSLEEVMAAREEGQEVGWQLYLNSDRGKAAQSVRRAVAAGAQSIWLTVDRQVYRANDQNPKNHRKLYAAEPVPWGTPLDRDVASTTVPQIDITTTWSDIAWLQSLAPGLPIVVKGLGAWEDVELARTHGATAVVLSNHGGRQLDYAHAPIQTLHDLHLHSPSTLLNPDFSVNIDGGIRRGSDVVKALCLGAKAVGVGRPFIYSATAWGSEGVEKALMILRQEIDIAMRSLGVTSADQLGPEYVDCSKL